MSTTPVPEGRRARKKAATRASISREALRLFLERGYDAVSVRDVAAAADVAVATVFKHFSGKEALVFDEDTAVEDALVAAVSQRPAGTAILDALERHVLGMRGVADAREPTFRAFVELVHATPTLDGHWQLLSSRHAEALATALEAETAGWDEPLSWVRARVVARSVLDVLDLARRTPSPVAAVHDAFALLRAGWPH